MIKVRRKGRERAFQVLFGCSFFKKPDIELARRIYFHFFVSTKIPELDRFTLDLLEGVFCYLDEVDDMIVSVAKNWKISRIAKVELAILRMSIYEILFRSDIPTKVSINEGIELSKKYGDINSHRFVNGILDAVAKKQNL